jgi:pimeloyl-ACP methyl ester carboxylesterase
MEPRVLPWGGEISLPGSSGLRVMLIAGFGSGPETLRGLGEHLRDHVGASVLIAPLAAHTGDARAFYRSRGWHYFREAEERFLALWAEKQEPLLLGGYSTGGLVALLIGARHPAKVAGLVLMSPALRLSATGKQLVGYTFGSVYYVGLPLGMLLTAAGLAWEARKHGWTRGRRWLGLAGSAGAFAAAAVALRRITVPLEGGGPMERDGEEILPPHFARASLATGSTLVPLQLAARWRLSHVELPICLVFGEEDTVVDIRFARLRTAGRHNAELRIVPHAPHRVVTHEGCHAVVADFVARTAATSRRADARLQEVDEQAVPAVVGLPGESGA